MSLFAASGCNEQTSYTTTDQRPVIDNPSPGIFGVAVDCANPGDCPREVAALYNPYNPEGAIICTGSNVGEVDGKTIIATNKHCVSGITNDCSRLVAEFPGQDGLSRAGGSCTRILAESPDPVVAREFTNLDYAFFVLDQKVDRPSFKMAARPLSDNSQVTVHYLDTSAQWRLSIRSTKCKTVMRHMLNTSYTDGENRIVTLWGCGTPHGSSGSAVLNDQGEMVAMIFGGPEADKMELSSVFADGWQKKIVAAESKTNLAVRLGCIDLPELGLKVDNADACVKPATLVDVAHILSAEDQKELVKLMSWSLDRFDRLDGSKVLAFEVVGSYSGKIALRENQQLIKALTVRPKCFNRTENWAWRYEKSSWRIVSDYDEYATLDYKVPVIYGFLESDDEMRLTVRFEMTTVPTTYEFNPNEVMQNARGQVRPVPAMHGDLAELPTFEAPPLGLCRGDRF